MNNDSNRGSRKSTITLLPKHLTLEKCHEGRKWHLRRPHFSKGLTKMAILLDCKHPGMLCLALRAQRKVQKLDFQSAFSTSKNVRISLNYRLGAHFLLKWFFDNFNFQTTFLLKVSIFWKQISSQNFFQNNLMVWFLEEVLAGKFVFNVYWP